MCKSVEQLDFARQMKQAGVAACFFLVLASALFVPV